MVYYLVTVVESLPTLLCTHWTASLIPKPPPILAYIYTEVEEWWKAVKAQSHLVLNGVKGGCEVYIGSLMREGGIAHWHFIVGHSLARQDFGRLHS